MPFGPLGIRIPLRTDPEPRSSQYILFAASTGQRAIEDISRGHGKFTTALLNGLKGKGHSKVLSRLNLRYEVGFLELVEYVLDVRSNVSTKRKIWYPHQKDGEERKW